MTKEQVALHFLNKELSKVKPNSETAHSLGIAMAVLEKDHEGTISWLMSEVNRLTRVNRELATQRENLESLVSTQSTMNSELKKENDVLIRQITEQKNINHSLRAVVKGQRIVQDSLEERLKQNFRREVLSDSNPPSPIISRRDKIQIEIPEQYNRRETGALESDEV